MPDMLKPLRWRKNPTDSAAQFYSRLSTERGFHTGALPSSIVDGWRDAKCLFVLSTGRTGTMQLAAVLDCADEVIGLHEPSPTLIHFGAEAYAEGGRGEKWRSVARATRDEYVVFAGHLGKIYAETNNRLTFIAPALSEVYPASRFIHLHRHPYEVIRSGLSRRWYDGSKMDYSLISPRPSDPFSVRWESLSAVEKIAWFWFRVNDEACSFLETLPPERRATLRASDLFRCNWDAIRKIFIFVGAELPAEARVKRVLRYQLNATRKRALVKDDDWTTFGERQAKAIVCDLAERLGYSL